MQVLCMWEQREKEVPAGPNIRTEHLKVNYVILGRDILFKKKERSLFIGFAMPEQIK